MSDINLYINYEHVADNIEYLRKGKKTILMVKANAYGMGINHIKKLIQHGYDFFGVSTLDEAIEIRKIDQNCEILVCTPISEYNVAVENNIIVTIIDANDVIDGLRYHIKFDTGMGRLGIKNNFNSLEPEGIYTHFPIASDTEFSKKQIAEFREISKLFKNVKYIHMQNTLGSIKYDIDFCNMVRIGIGQFGLLSNHEEAKEYGQHLKPVLKLETRVINYKENYDGYIGYDLTEYVNGNIATIRIGYYDGLSRSFGGYTFKNGNKIVGLICMCQTMIKTNKKQEYIEIFGEEENIYNILKYGKISTYEFLVSLSTRVNKIEVNNG